jgi:RNA recognition motif-containing protein
MRMFRTQSLLAVGVGLVRTNAFVAPAGVSAMRLLTTGMTRSSRAAQATSVVHRAGAGCQCPHCNGRIARAVSGLRMMSSTEYGETQTAAPAGEPVKLYIGNLGWETTTNELQEHFAAYGDASDCYVVVDRATGESRGFGFVSFASEDEARKAVAGMNGKELDGRRIRVDISKPKGTQAPEPEGCKLYVGNLGYSTTSEDLREHFSKYGSVADLTVVTDRETGNSRGFAFVTFSSPSEASAAVDALDGYEVDGRELRVNLSKPREARTQDSGYGGGRGDNSYGNRGGGGGGGGGAVDTNKVFVGNLGWDTTQEDLQSAFSQYGQLTDVKLVTDRDTGNSRGFAFVTYANSEAAESAIQQMDGQELDGREIRVNISQPKKPRYEESFNDEW